MPKEKVEEIFDKYAKGYSTGAFAPPRYKTTRDSMVFADEITWHFITKYLPHRKNIRILDAGGGDGYWAERLFKLGYQNIVISDISQGMLTEAQKRFKKIRKKHNVEFFKSDIRDMKEFDSNSFDFVFSQYDAVSLCMKPAKAIKELARVASSKAYMIVSLDTKFRRIPDLIEAGLIDEAEELLQTNIAFDYDFPGYMLTWEELADYFTNAGLEVVEVIGAPIFMQQVNEDVVKGLLANSKNRERLLKIELDHCTNRSLINFAGHLQMVGQKV